MIRFVLILVFSASLCSWGAKVEETLATVNGEAIYLSDYHTNSNNVIEELRKTSRQDLAPADIREQRQKVLEQMIDDLVLLQEARRLKVKVYDKDTKAGVEEIKSRFRKDDEGMPLSEADTEKAFAVELRRQRLTYADFEERIRKQLMVIRLVELNIKSKIVPPVEKEVQDFFKKVQSVGSSTGTATQNWTKEEIEEMQKLAQLLKDRTAERVRARHILVKVPPKASMAEKSKALNAIKKVKQQLDQGGDFADLARKFSEDMESSRKGGDLGYFIRGWMVPAFEKAAFSASVGEVVGPIETEFGFHLIVVEEKRASVPLRFEDIQDDLTNYLMQRNFQKNLREYVHGLRAKSDIKIKENLLSDALSEGNSKSGVSQKEGKP